MIRVHIVSGFLGAGKTTLIKKMMKEIEGKIVVLENEFGEVGIDGEIIERENYDVVEMAQGCICCSMKSDFKTTILSIVKDYTPEHIIIEPTGIGMLSEILKLFNEEDLKNNCKLTLPIVVVDVLDYLTLIEEFGYFYKDQIINAGILVLSKIQLMEDKNIDEIVKSLRELNKNAEIITKDWNDFTEIEFDELLNISFVLSEGYISFIEETKTIKGKLQSYSIGRPKSLSEESLEDLLSKLDDDKYGRIVRVKGFVQGEDGDLEFNYVNGRYDICINKLHNSSRICIIGSDINKKALSEMFLLANMK